MGEAELGSFVILAELGGGPRGVSFRARHATLGRDVAVKHLFATVEASSAEFVRLSEEVERLRAVASEHVAVTLSVDLIDGRPLIEMESLGDSLEKVLRRGALKPEPAVAVMRDVLLGLRSLHAAGIVHGNLKPSNILQEASGEGWKVADGAMVHIAGPAPTLLAGSVVYSAPESIAQDPVVDAQSDLFVTGMIGLESLLAARLAEAFPGLTRSASPTRWLAWLEDPETRVKPVHELRPDLPPEFSQFLDGLLTKDRTRRFQSAAAALDALDAVARLVVAMDLEHQSPTVMIPAPGSARQTPPAAAAPVHPVLLIEGPAGFHERFELGDRRVYRIGRDPENDIRLPDDTKSISRLHAELKREQDHFVINDLNSQNGVWVSGRRRSSVELSAGVPVRIGPYSLSLASAAAPVADEVTQAVARPKSPPAEPVKGPVAPAASPPASRSSLELRHWIAIVSVAAVVGAGIGWWAWPRDPGMTAEDRVDRPEEPVGVPPPDSRIQALARVRELLGRREFDAALKEAEAVLTTYPGDADAQSLKEQALAELNVPPPIPIENPPAERSNRGRKPTVATADADARRIERDKRLAGLNQQGLAAMQSGDLVAALASFLAIQKEDPAFPDVAARIADVRRRQAHGYIQEGQAAEMGGDLVRSLRAYRRALDADTSSADAQSAVKRLQARMAREGLEAFKRAETYENYQRLPEARREYQKAFEYLPDDDPLKKEAKARLDRIGKQLE